MNLPPPRSPPICRTFDTLESDMLKQPLCAGNVSRKGARRSADLIQHPDDDHGALHDSPFVVPERRSNGRVDDNVALLQVVSGDPDGLSFKDGCGGATSALHCLAEFVEMRLARHDDVRSFHQYPP